MQLSIVLYTMKQFNGQLKGISWFIVEKKLTINKQVNLFTSVYCHFWGEHNHYIRLPTVWLLYLPKYTYTTIHTLIFFSELPYSIKWHDFAGDITKKNISCTAINTSVYR